MPRSPIDIFLRQQRENRQALDQQARKRARRQPKGAQGKSPETGTGTGTGGNEHTRLAAEIEMAVSRNRRKGSRENLPPKPDSGGSALDHRTSQAAAHRATADLNCLAWQQTQGLKTAVEEIMKQRKNSENTQANPGDGAARPPE
ncbi:MAG: hypothetical protein WB987_01290 [Candidatus Acidiferrales bacterium]